MIDSFIQIYKQQNGYPFEKAAFTFLLFYKTSNVF